MKARNWTVAATLLSTRLMASDALAQEPTLAPRAVTPAPIQKQTCIGVIRRIDAKQRTIVVVPSTGMAIQSQQTQSPAKGGKDASGGSLVILITEQTIIRSPGKGIEDGPTPTPIPDQAEKGKPTPGSDQTDKGKPNPIPAPNQNDKGKPSPIPSPGPDQNDKGKPTPTPAPNPTQTDKGKPTSANPGDQNPKVDGDVPLPSQFDQLKVDQLVRIVHEPQDGGKYQAVQIQVLPSKP